MNDLERSRPGALVGLAVTGVGLGGALGALTNTINGWVSPVYFRKIMGWEDVVDVWRASIAQGIFEGLLFGLAFAMIFVTVVGIVTRARSPYRLAARYLAVVSAAALACWAVGGAMGMGLAALSPEFFQHSVRGVPKEFAEMIRFAWVGGSMGGIELGGLASIVVASVLFRARWQTMRTSATSPNGPHA
jgi:hypothetical protein